jgi:hypothetical protein
MKNKNMTSGLPSHAQKELKRSKSSQQKLFNLILTRAGGVDFSGTLLSIQA